MKRYLLFSGLPFYPNGGWDDFINDFDTIEEALKTFTDDKDYSWREWYQIIDTKSKKEVKFGSITDLQKTHEQ